MSSFKVISVYNRLPYTVNFQWDQQPDEIGAHTTRYLSYEMAVAAIKASVIYMDADDLETVEHGVVPELDEGYQKPYTQEDVDAIQDIPGWQMGVVDPQNYEKRTIKNPKHIIKSRKSVTPGIDVIASATPGL